MSIVQIFPHQNSVVHTPRTRPDHMAGSASSLYDKMFGTSPPRAVGMVPAMSNPSMRLFQKDIGAPVPCASGARNYSAKCPQGWTNSNGSICEPPADYTGACQTQDFSGYNAAMLAKWEQLCNAYWA